MPDLILDNIDRVRATPLPRCAAWKITFASANTGMCHQLYINGQLADATQYPSQRMFVLSARSAPMQAVVAAVAPEMAWIDLSHELPPEVRHPAWVYRTAVVRRPGLAAGTRVLLLDDHARGQLDPVPIAAAMLWPADAQRWGFGEDDFGIGGMGYGGSGAPGLGNGAMGMGMFGIDELVVHLAAALAEPGRHQLVVRLLDPHGRATDLPAEDFEAVLPQ